MKLFIKSVTTKTSLYYTFIVTLFSIIVLLSNTSAENISLDPSRVLWFLPFCICFAISNTVLKYKNIESVTRWAIHSILTITSAFLFIILPADLNTSSGNFMGIILIIAIYLFGILLSAILSSRIKKSIKQDNELKSKKTKSR